MNKKELKSAFEKEFKNINVSNELKEKTLNAINTSSKQKTSHIPYIRNFAAVFVVTLLCLSIYFSNNSYKNQPNTYDTLKENSIYETEATENSLEKAYGAPLQKSLNCQAFC